MRFDAVIEKGKVKIFEKNGDIKIEKILAEMDGVVKKEIESVKK